MGLVLTRKPGQRILVRTPDGDVWVAYDGCPSAPGLSAKIGIDAPKEFHIIREELIKESSEEEKKREEKLYEQ